MENVPLGTVESNFSFIAWRNTSFYLLIELIWEQLIVATFCLLFYAQFLMENPAREMTYLPT